MSDPENEATELREVLARAVDAASGFLDGLGRDPAAPRGRDEVAEAFGSGPLPQEGVGGVAAVDELATNGVSAATRSAGPRFFHFVTGGATPAALAADWLTSTLDQNAFSWVSSPLASRAEQVGVSWLKELFGLPPVWGGVITTGATMANFTALAAARHWWAGRLGRRRRRRRLRRSAGAARAELGLHPRQRGQGVDDARAGAKFRAAADR